MAANNNKDWDKHQKEMKSSRKEPQQNKLSIETQRGESTATEMHKSTAEV